MANLRALAINNGEVQQIQDTDTLTTGILNAADGSATDPSMSFANNTDTGLYSYATSIGFSVNGSQAGYLSGSGLFLIRSGGNSILSVRRTDIHGVGEVSELRFSGSDDGGTSTYYASIIGECIDDTSPNEYGGISFETLLNGGVSTPMRIEQGVILGSSSDPGQYHLAVANEITAGQGSVSTPAFSFISDPNSGMYLQGADNVRFATGGVWSYQINSDGSLAVNPALNYETLVTDDDDIPNKKYVDDTASSASLWTQGVGLAYLTTTTDSVIVGDTALTGTEKLKVDGGDLLLEGGNLNVPSTSSATVGVIEFGGTHQMHVYGGGNSIFLGNAGNFTATVVLDTIAIGAGALVSETSVNSCIAIGRNALNSSTGGSDSTIVIGNDACTGITTNAQSNVVVGHNAMTAATSGRENVVIGNNAYQDGTQSDNVVIGYQAGFNATSSGRGVVIGSEAANAAIMTGNYNIIIGYQATQNITSGTDNVSIGYLSNRNLSTGLNNLALGTSALTANDTGSGNIALGYRAMANTAISAVGGLDYNVAIGYQAFQYMDNISDQNVAVGYYALRDVDGLGAVTNTVAIGSQAGSAAAGASNCVYIGYQAGQTNSTSNRLIIENSNDVATPLIDGDFSGNTVTINGKLTVTGLIDPTGLVLTEQAADPATTGAGEGTIWVRNDVPNTLIFTDDAGTDFEAIPWTRSGTVLSPRTSGDTLQVGSGTVSAPGYSFSSDTDVGFYYDGGVLGVSVNGSQTAAYGLTSNFALLTDGGETLMYTFREDTHGSAVIHRERFYGKNASASSVIYARRLVNCTNDTASSESGSISYYTISSGTSTVQLVMGGGVVVGNSSRYGNGTLNVENSTYIPDGTTSDPSIRLRNDTDTGIYSAGVGELNVSVAGSEVVSVDSTGVTVTGDVSCTDIETSGQVSINGTATSTRWLEILDDSTSNSTYGLHLTSSFSAAKSATWGQRIECAYSGSGTMTNYYGIDIEIVANGSGCTITTAYGVRSRMTAGTGDTISTAYCFIADADVTTSGGTITDIYGLYVDDLDFGGTTVNNYGVYIDNQTGSGNNWGIYQAGTSDENYFGGPVGIGTASIDTSAALEIDTTTGALLVSRMTTTQRNALTAVNGMIIYNTSTNAFNFYENGAWVTK